METKKKISYPERLHDIFMQFGYCGKYETKPIETFIALLIDEIIQEVREECQKRNLQKK
ncbi:MAG: hypothetical protein Q8J68_07785 [Methanolobus sp.]|uniref:hypothetical protein n=1 Tax=Methanolobus sp. TaxID=1874737 RepID=UPI002731AEB5|nr:hypothetical protein [Methanolobus sp.]MDP2217168.1 hypothetical protein [Methanolobus sp.]